MGPNLNNVSSMDEYSLSLKVKDGITSSFLVYEELVSFVNQTHEMKKITRETESCIKMNTIMSYKSTYFRRPNLTNAKFLLKIPMQLIV